MEEAEIADLRQSLYETGAVKGGNLFMKGFCDALKEELLTEQ